MLNDNDLSQSLHDEHITIKYKNETIERIKTATYLGVKIDEDIKWKSHTKLLLKRLSPIAGIFHKICRQIPQKIKRQIFFALFQSKLAYDITVWGCAGQETIKIIQKIQNKAIKNLFGYNKLTSSKYIHNEQNLNTINQLYQIKAVTNIFKITKNQIHTNTNLKSASEIHNYNTRKA